MNYYATLNLSPGASFEEIKKAHRKLAMLYHPDHCPGDSSASEKFKQIQIAYEFLMNNTTNKKQPQRPPKKKVLKFTKPHHQNTIFGENYSIKKIN